MSETIPTQAPVHSQTSFSHADLVKAGEGTLFGPDAPKLPRREMLMFSRIENIDAVGGTGGRGQLEAVLDITPELWFFDCHFVDDPVMPGCLGMDGLWQLVGFFLAWSGFKGRGRALGVKEVKFTGQVLPNVKQIRYIIDIKRVLNGKLIMALADGRLEADGETIYVAKDIKVGLFQ